MKGNNKGEDLRSIERSFSVVLPKDTMRRYTMKKLLNISLLLLVVCMSGSLSCKSWFQPKKKVQTAEPGLSASDFFRTETRKAITQTQRVPEPTIIQTSSATSSGGSGLSRPKNPRKPP